MLQRRRKQHASKSSRLLLWCLEWACVGRRCCRLWLWGQLGLSRRNHGKNSPFQILKKYLFVTDEGEGKDRLYNAITTLFNQNEGKRYCLRGAFSLSDVTKADSWNDVKVTVVNGHKNKEKVDEESTETAKAGDVWGLSTAHFRLERRLNKLPTIRHTDSSHLILMDKL